jgi:hypothetical protein
VNTDAVGWLASELGSPREGAENIFVAQVVYMFLQWKQLRVGNWSSHRDSRQGAALAYYSVFSFGCIIVIAIDAGSFQAILAHARSGPRGLGEQ